jgi:twitching motility protein PilT
MQMQLATVLTGIVHQRLLPRSGGGVIPAYEVMLATASVQNLIREGKFNQLHNQIITGHEVGMQTLESALNSLVTAGSVAYDDAAAATLHPEEIIRPTAAGYPSGAPTPRRPGAISR